MLMLFFLDLAKTVITFFAKSKKYLTHIHVLQLIKMPFF